ncbi:hypothetical protein GO755_39015 [Spirosoma sp. HMF4905]|uniref:DUF5681 domain-containing protein n=1 Tax=Spirosoma arboris TaxID=2682092 RepID=A0A7K1SQQ0_9BACT|nr:DUF5681 domain-containing protein [Spirosoma arboris]MVM36070.1 hypothetical protein [Spirosoma arboris]
MPFSEGESGNPDTQFQKGQSGNPAGRPRGSISQWMKEFGEASEIKLDITVTDQDGKVSKSTATISTNGQTTINQAIAVRGLQKALKGDYQFFKEVLNRTEGRVPQPIDLGGQPDNPIVIDDLSKLSTDELIRRRAAIRRRIADEGAGQEGI